ncbi:MAG TPA: hypothetical protein PKM73_03230 [Verrucomicrobiota bacterium]|nr:hypothetical protein [Verrucomicrobiota bacterium]
MRVVAAGLVLSLGLSAKADLLYDNGAPNQFTGNEMTGWIQAEDFVFTSPQVLTDVRFWDYEYDSAAYTGSIMWWIYADIAGAPGSTIYTGTATPTRSLTGNLVSGMNEYVNDFSVGSLALAAGTYWLGLHNGDPADYRDWRGFYWETTDSSSPKPVSYGMSDPSPFLSDWQIEGYYDFQDEFYPLEHAFQLYGVVPEPSAILSGGVLALAAGLAVARRRKA